MQVLNSLSDLNNARPLMMGKIGFVPTMGALHEGHLSLGKIARDNSDIVIYSIFVNPTQFAPGEDLDKYPRDVEIDLDKLKNIADFVYLPSETDIYPNGKKITVKARESAKGLESDFRPGFFDGIATVVSTLFEQIKPHIAVFGEKDFQQLQVIKELDTDIKIISSPIIRESDGLAMSSRNVYLSEEERKIAPKLFETISSNLKIEEMKEQLLEAGFKIDYIEQRWGRILAAVHLGSTRLIDNVQIT